MNYYRRHIGDYMTATAGLSLREHGAYALLLDYYYSTEKPLALDPKSIFRIAQCHSAEDKRAVASVLQRFFVKCEDGWHQKRADDEIAIAKQVIEKQRISGKAAAEKRWSGAVGQPIGSTNRSTHNLSTGSTIGSRGGSEHGSAMQPPTTNQIQETTPATVTRTTEPAQPAAGAAHETQPPDPAIVAHVDQLRVTAGIGTDQHAKAGELHGICAANQVRATASHPLILDWVRDGVTPAQLTRAITEARKSNAGQLNPAYLEPILERVRNGTIDAKPQPAPISAAHSTEKANQALLEARQARESASPMPDHIRALMRAPKPAA